MSGGKTTSKKLKLAERRQRAIALRKSGATFDQIAAVISREFAEPSYGKPQAYRDVKGVLETIEQQTSEEMATWRRLESERLDMASLAIARQVQAGDLQAIDRWIKLIDARAKLWGLNLPPAARPTNQAAASAIELELISKS